MKLMLQVAFDYLKTHKKASLSNIFQTIKTELKVHWKQSFPELMMEKIEEKKLGELYTYLTTDGRFVMLDKDVWTIVSALTSKELLAARSKVVLENVIDENLETPVEDENDVPYNANKNEHSDEIVDEDEIDVVEELKTDI